MNFGDNLLSVLGGPGRAVPRPAQVSGPQQGIIKSVGISGVMITLPDYDGGEHLCGPLPWNMAQTLPAVSGVDAPHTHLPTPPPVEAECLVVFVGPGITRGWVLAWWVPA